MKSTDLKVKRDGQDRLVTTPDGDEFYLKKEDSGFSCNGNYGSLKSLKVLIARGKIKPDSVAVVETPEPDSEAVGHPEHTHMPFTFDCVEPCAILVMLLGQDEPMEVEMTNDIMTTLDRYGWLDEKGEPDVERAEKEYKRFGSFDKSPV